MSVRHDLTFVKGDSIEFKIKFDGAITNITDVTFGVKSNYKATSYAIFVSSSLITSEPDGEITIGSDGVYDCLIYASTMAEDAIIPTNYVYEIKVTLGSGGNSDIRVYTPVYGQFKLLPNVIV